MSEHLPGRVLTCRSKVRHPTKKAARSAARATSAKYGATMRPYKCAICDGYHLTTMRGKW